MKSTLKLIAVRHDHQYDIYFRTPQTDHTDVGVWLCSMRVSERVSTSKEAIAQAMFQLANLAHNPHLSEEDHANLDYA